MHSSLSRSELRRQLRAARRALPPAERTAKETRILHALLTHPAMRRARQIALYWPADGEVDLRALHRRIHPKQTLYLPVLAQGSRLRFAPWLKQGAMRRNRFGIPEPRHRLYQLRRPVQMDVVLMPLVGFDEHGNRLGMGGGFYDRSFAFRHARKRWRKPLLIGVAFELQRCPRLCSEPWDVPLDGIVTELGLRLRDRTPVL